MICASHKGRGPVRAGFTLVEVLVALAVFSIAVLALLNAQGENLRTATAIEAKTFAQIVVENRLIETMAESLPPAVGLSNGETEMAARTWYWTRQVAQTQNVRILRIDVAVRSEPDGQVLASLAAFRAKETP